MHFYNTFLVYAMFFGIIRHQLNVHQEFTKVVKKEIQS